MTAQAHRRDRLLVAAAFTALLIACAFLIFRLASERQQVLDDFQHGAWLAVDPEFHRLPLLWGAGVLFWVAGFDILYACEDVAFDRGAGLKSIPAALGIPRALGVARACHAVALAAFASPLLMGLRGWYAAAVVAVALLLLYEHALVRADDLRRANRAFFHVNAVISALLAAGALAELALG